MGSAQVPLPASISALQERFTVLLLLVAAESWSWVLGGADLSVPTGSPAPSPWHPSIPDHRQLEERVALPIAQEEPSSEVQGPP